MTSRFTWGKDTAPQLFPTAEAAAKAVMDEMIAVAVSFGFDTLQAEGNSVLCVKAAIALLVAVKEDGTWECRVDNAVTESGQGAVMLRAWLSTLPLS